MKTQAFKATIKILSLLAAAFLFARSAAFADLPAGADYQLESSVVDNGGGEKMTGGEYAAKGSVARAALPDNIGIVSGGDYANREGFYNPPHFTFQKGLPVSLSLPSGDITLTIPPNSVGKDVFDLTLNKNPLNQPVSVDPGKITDANDKMVYNEGAWSQLFPNNLSEMSIFDEQDFYTKPLANRGIMTISYKDDNNDGIMDGSNPPVRIDTLNAWMLDETVNSWVKLQDAGADKTGKTLTVYFGMPGVYALLGAQDQTVKDVIAYPVPFRPNGPNAGTEAGQTGAEGTCPKCNITFQSVPQGGNIEIYTLDGRLVRKLAIPTDLSTPTVKWDVKTAAGGRAASGVYIWRIVSGSNTKTGKLMVIW